MKRLETKHLLQMLGFVALSVPFAALSGCDDSPDTGEEIGETFDDAADDTGDAFDDAADDVDDTLDDWEDDVEDIDG